MHHIFFIHASADEHLGYFHVLAIVNSAPVNIRVYVFLKYAFHLGIYWAVGFLGI